MNQINVTQNQAECFLSTMFKPSITRLSEDRIQLIRNIFPTFSSFFAFCMDNVDLSESEIEDLINEIYPRDFSLPDGTPSGWWHEDAWTYLDDDGEYQWKDMSVLYNY